MNALKRRTACAVLFLVLVALHACDKPDAKPKPVAVSGTVTLDGKPLAEGLVYFKTVQTGAIDTLPVKDGKFEGRAEPGERRVEVNAYRTKTLKDDPMGGEVQENAVHARYNTESTLSATVTADGPNEFTFDVKRK